MKKTIAITVLILAMTGISVFAAMGGHGGSSHHGTTYHYGDGHYYDRDAHHESFGSAGHHYGPPGIPALTNRMGAMMEQMSTALNHPDMDHNYMESIGTMMDRLSDNMHTLSQKRNSGTMSEREMEQMQNELDTMHRRLNSINREMER